MNEEQAKIGGNYLKVKDDNLPYSAFHLMVVGHIQSGNINDRDGVSCKFEFHAGTDWQLVSGNKVGISQHAYKAPQTNRRVVWNFPFELTYRGMNVFGWP
jgi:B9 domain-containing protein 1